MNAEGKMQNEKTSARVPKWKIQIPKTNLQRNSKAQTSRFAGLVIDYSLVLEYWGLDVIKALHFWPLCLYVSVTIPLHSSCKLRIIQNDAFFAKTALRKSLRPNGA
jgi:hypothetical protein